MSTPSSTTINIFIRVAVFALLGSGVATWTKVKNSWRSRASKDWPTTVATIHSGMVQKIPHSTNYRVELSYSYFIDEYRSGTYDRTFLSECESDTFVRRMKGLQIPTRYARSKPDKSFLEEKEIDRLNERAALLERNDAMAARDE